MMLVLVTGFTPINKLRQVEKQQLSQQLLDINSSELATFETKKWL